MSFLCDMYLMSLDEKIVISSRYFNSSLFDAGDGDADEVNCDDC